MGCNQSKKTPPKEIDPDEQQRLEQKVCSKENIHKLYEFGTVLGTGGFGIVKVAIPRIKQSPQKKYAVKIIPKIKVAKKMHLLLRELEILKTLDHPNIIKFHEIYEDDQQFYIVQEYCSGGELLKRITSKHYKWTERDVAKVMSKVISAVGHMHAKGIVHRDLKPENILISSNEKNAEIKLIDFGLSNKYKSKDRLHTMVGTPLYVSPQVLQGKYTESCDEWSLGVIMYILLVGYPPFYAESKNGIFECISKGKYQMSGKEWKQISADAKDLVKRFLDIDEKKRIKVRDASKHPFFNILKNHQVSESDYEGEEKIHTQNILNLLKTYKTKSRFADEVMKLMVNRMTEKEIQDLTAEFKKLDKDNTGLLTPAEIKEGMLKSEAFKIDKSNQQIAEQQMKQLDEEIEHIFDELAHWEHEHELFVQKHMSSEHKSEEEKDRQLDEVNQQPSHRTIQYTEFIARTLDYHKFVTDEKLYAIFKYCDSSNHECITVEDLHKVFQRHGRDILIEEVQEIVDQVDPKHNGKIKFDDFKRIMAEGQIRDNIKHHQD